MGCYFNIHMCSSSKLRTDVTVLIESNGFPNIMNKVSRITSYTSSTINVFITDDVTKIIASDAMIGDISDH